MPEYLVELYSVADPDPTDLARLGDRNSVRYLRSILIPGDETCLHLVEADSAEQVKDAFAQVGLKADRIVEAVGLPAHAPAGAPRRPMSRKEMLKSFGAP
jgi:Nickel responsive protein SCO4226-like